MNKITSSALKFLKRKINLQIGIRAFVFLMVSMCYRLQG